MTDNIIRWVIGIVSIGFLLLIMGYFWLYGYRYLMRIGRERFAFVQLILGPILGFLTGVMIFKQSLYLRLVEPIESSEKRLQAGTALLEESLGKYFCVHGFEKVRLKGIEKERQLSCYYREARHILVKFREFFQILDWSASNEDPLFVIREHQKLRSAVNEHLPVPRFMRFKVPVVMTILIIEAIDHDGFAWLEDELLAVSGSDWLGGEVQSILVLDRSQKRVWSLKPHRQGDTVGLNYTLDLIQTFLNELQKE